MLKKLACVLALVIPTTASADRIYDIRATRAGHHELSCGATRRMLKDKHVLRIDDQTEKVYVDGFEFSPWTTFDDPELTMSFHGYSAVLKRPQHTVLIFQLYVNMRGLSGLYILQGKTVEGNDCSDAVWVDGTRR